MKCILIYWQPKDIPEVIESIDSLQIDKLIIKYYRYPKVQQLTDLVIKNKLIDKYDYFIIVTNDVVVSQDNLSTLLNDIEKTKAKVISAVMNVDLSDKREYLNITLERPKGGIYKWVKRGELTGIQPVQFAGFPLMAIHSSILREYRFDGDERVPTDVRFCNWCEDNNIPVYVNVDNEMYHMRYVGEMLAGYKNPELWLNGERIE